MSNYYNEFDPKAAAWLRQLIKDGLIPDGVVDERSIADVDGYELHGFTQCHFFAGIGGWSLALQLAGCPEDRPVWTGSCPCQPFSAAGKNKGNKDERHLWPEFYRLIRECKPDTIFGEQVEGAIKHGWLDDLQTDLEGEGYAVGHCVLGAHSINAAHIRQRLYWVGNAGGNGHSTDQIRRETKASKEQSRVQQFKGSSAGVGVADSISDRREQQPNTSTASLRREGVQPQKQEFQSSDLGTAPNGWMGDTEHNGHFTSQESASPVQPITKRREERSDVPRESEGTSRREPAADVPRCVVGRGEGGDAVDWLYCRDNKYRPIESSIKPLVDGLPKGMVYSGDPCESVDGTQEARILRLKGYGNAIVPGVAAEFVKAFMGTHLVP